MVELSENMNVFHDVKVNLITVISIHRMGGFLLKIYTKFFIVLTLPYSRKEKCSHKKQPETRKQNGRYGRFSKLLKVLNILP